MSEMEPESTTIQYRGNPYTLVERDKRNIQELSNATGYSTRQIQEMKAAGCPFFGRFSSVQILRIFEYNHPDWRKLPVSSV